MEKNFGTEADAYLFALHFFRIDYQCFSDNHRSTLDSELEKKAIIKALSLNPDDADLWTELARCFKTGDEAEDAIRKAISLDQSATYIWL